MGIGRSDTIPESSQWPVVVSLPRDFSRRRIPTVLQTAPLNEYILPGTARAHLIAKCRELEIPVCEEAFTLAQMMAADEIIITSSGSFCVPVSHVDGMPVGGGAPELLRKLQDALVADFLRETE